MRGKRVPPTLITMCLRIIPAHAGQTTSTSDRIALPTDHPRACGANFSITVLLCVSFGSSPRMRGKRRPRLCMGGPLRIIPAHAGQTRGWSPSRSLCPDHPRACGANCFPALWFPALTGSSPRMRGKRSFLCIVSHRSDHPRACGANVLPEVCRVIYFGSSPRMRGKLLSCHCVSSLLRIIPAHAGQTVRQNVSQSPSPDHPRACGANPRPPVRHRPAFGSSPRMRGKPPYGHAPLEHARIIPAHAGQTKGGRG